MSITVNIHKTHRQHTDGKEVVAVEGSTIGACLESLTRQYPGMQTAVFDDSGKLRNQIEIYLNMTSAYPNELAKPVAPGDEITIILMLAGG